jgi:hypothetical protein
MTVQWVGSGAISNNDCGHRKRLSDAVVAGFAALLAAMLVVYITLSKRCRSVGTARNLMLVEILLVAIGTFLIGITLRPADAYGYIKLCCLPVTVLASVAPLITILQWFEHTMETLPDLNLPATQDAVGWYGMLVFMHGGLDLVLDVWFCLTLFQCGEWCLFGCATTTTVATTAVSCYLGFSALRTIQRDSPAARGWVMGHRRLVAAVVVASSSRIESIAIFRLRLCGRDVIKLPMADKYFHFLKNAGMYHHLIEDFPHAVVSVALLLRDGDCGQSTGQSRHFWQPLSSNEMGWLNLAFCAASIGWGLVVKGLQLQTLASMQEAQNMENRISDFQTQLFRTSILPSSTQASKNPVEPRSRQLAEPEPESESERVSLRDSISSIGSDDSFASATGIEEPEPRSPDPPTTRPIVPRSMAVAARGPPNSIGESQGSELRTSCEF